MAERDERPEDDNTVLLKSISLRSDSENYAGEGKVAEEKEKGREQWANKAEFLLACIGYAVGLGSVWRFPWLAQQNGGGAFLIPYTIMLFIEGIPLFYLELSIGQRIRLGPIPLWKKVSPWSGGVGYAMCIASFLSSCFYNVIIAWCIYYFFLSWQNPLPWSTCPKPVFNKALNVTAVSNSTLLCQEIGSTQYFWYYRALEIGESIDDNSRFNWQIMLCLLASWIMVALSMIRGIQTTGKVVYFTATFPYIVLLIFLVKGFLLPGYKDGLAQLFVPEFSKLKDPHVWLAAAGQIFFSLSLAFGGLIAYASYNDVHSNTLKDSLIISFTNCGTALIAGVAIFSILGYRANLKSDFCYQEKRALANATYLDLEARGLAVNTSFDEIYNKLSENCTVKYFLSKGTGGSGLTFVAFTDAIDQLPGSIFFSLMFFLMLITLGLGSMFGSLEGLVTSLRDMPYFQKLRKELIIVIVTVPGFLLGVVFCQSSGEYLVQLFNTFSIDIPILMVALLELIFVVYFYGIDRLSDDIFFMTGSYPNLVFRILWRFVSPITIIFILSVSLYQMFTRSPIYEVWDRANGVLYTAPYPPWALSIGIIVFAVSFLFVPAWAISNLYRRRKAIGKDGEKMML